MRNKLLYLACLGALTLSSCGNEDNGLGVEPTPIPTPTPDTDSIPKGELISIEATLSTKDVNTRAVDKTFDKEDVLLAYVQAGKQTGADEFRPVTDEAGFDQSKASLYNRLLTLTMSSENVSHTAVNDNTNQTSSFTADSKYYWDDFSTSDYDLRESDRGIRLFYGYCYNGGTPSTVLDEASGAIGWTVEIDQRDTGSGKGTKSSDLLFAKTQDMIKYDHKQGDGSTRGTLTIPYTHAMSKITIEVVCRDGFDNSDEALANTTVKLTKVATKCTVTAPTATVESTADVADIDMHVTESNNKKEFSAIVAPTTLSLGNTLAEISDVNGIPYRIYITESLLNSAPTGKTPWKNELESVDAEENLQEGIAHAPIRTRAGEAHIDKGKGYRTKPGVHYHLTVNVDKQEITMLAAITDWNDVYAETTGTINFSNNITDKGEISLGDFTTFDIYKALASTGTPTNGAFDDNNSVDGINPATNYTYAGGTWSNSPKLYWPNAADKYYFRALSGAVASSDATSSTITISNTKDGGVNNNDLIWGTTPTDTDHSYAEGDPIAPRTGDVPLTFSHIMSKVKFILETETTGGVLAPNGVNLSGAKIQIDHIATSGHLTLSDGSISTTAADKTGTLFVADNIPVLTYESSTLTAKTGEQIVLPQEISADAKITITLSDGTTYSAVLKDCTVFKDGVLTTTPIDKWESGKRYTYTIHLKKEEMNFRALVGAWTDTEGKGNATLEWD